jgi:hypothetical protein
MTIINDIVIITLNIILLTVFGLLVSRVENQNTFTVNLLHYARWRQGWWTCCAKENCF